MDGEKCFEHECNAGRVVLVLLVELMSFSSPVQVESPVICRILDTADEHGLLSLSS